MGMGAVVEARPFAQVFRLTMLGLTRGATMCSAGIALGCNVTMGSCRVAWTTCGAGGALSRPTKLFLNQDAVLIGSGCRRSALSDGLDLRDFVLVGFT